MPKNSFLLYCDMYDSIRPLTVEQKAQLLDAIFMFHRNEPLYGLDPVVEMCFSFLSRAFERDRKKYEQLCEKNRKNVSIRWNKSNTTVYDRIRPDTKNTDTDLKAFKDNCLSLTSSSQSQSLAISQGGTGGKEPPGQPDGCPIDTPSRAPKKRKTPADGRPSACTPEQWEKYLAYSRKFLSDQHEQLGDMAKPDETKALAGAKTLDALIRIRGHPAAKVYRALEWAKSDPFWTLQVRSLGGLLAKGKNGETKFDNLCAAMVREAMQDERKT